jgi:hypothetical protein
VTVAMKAPPNASGHFHCCGPGESGRVYALPERGGTLDVSVCDERGFRRLGWVRADVQEPDGWDWLRRREKQRDEEAKAEHDFIRTPAKWFGYVWTCPRLPGQEFYVKSEVHAALKAAAGEAASA